MQFEFSSFSQLSLLDETQKSPSPDSGEKLVQLLLEEDDQEDFSTKSGLSSEIRSSGSMENLGASQIAENSFSSAAQVGHRKRPHSKSNDDSKLVKLGEEIYGFIGSENDSEISSVS